MSRFPQNVKYDCDKRWMEKKKHERLRNHSRKNRRTWVLGSQILEAKWQIKMIKREETQHQPTLGRLTLTNDDLMIWFWGPKSILFSYKPIRWDPMKISQTFLCFPLCCMFIQQKPPVFCPKTNFPWKNASVPTELRRNDPRLQIESLRILRRNGVEVGSVTVTTRITPPKNQHGVYKFCQRNWGVPTVETNPLPILIEVRCKTSAAMYQKSVPWKTLIRYKQTNKVVHRWS